ncbi:MAG TPA: sodium:proton antiporter [Gemmatales bacterium]|nr:sodium:proton antiporter [Gemmatales bacterium]
MMFAYIFAAGPAANAPGLLAAIPFCLLLLCIAILPLFHGTYHWWEKNRNKLLISVTLAGVTLLYYSMKLMSVCRRFCMSWNMPSWMNICRLL